MKYSEAKALQKEAWVRKKPLKVQKLIIRRQDKNKLQRLLKFRLTIFIDVIKVFIFRRGALVGYCTA